MEALHWKRRTRWDGATRKSSRTSVEFWCVLVCERVSAESLRLNELDGVVTSKYKGSGKKEWFCCDCKDNERVESEQESKNAKAPIDTSNLLAVPRATVRLVIRE